MEAVSSDAAGTVEAEGKSVVSEDSTVVSAAEVKEAMPAVKAVVPEFETAAVLLSLAAEVREGTLESIVTAPAG